MTEQDRVKRLLKENPHIDEKGFCIAQERIRRLRKEGITKEPEYLLDSASSIPPMIRVDHSASR
jgi:hypothetical protein